MHAPAPATRASRLQQTLLQLCDTSVPLAQVLSQTLSLNGRWLLWGIPTPHDVLCANEYETLPHQQQGRCWPLMAA